MCSVGMVPSEGCAVGSRAGPALWRGGDMGGSVQRERDREAAFTQSTPSSDCCLPSPVYGRELAGQEEVAQGHEGGGAHAGTTCRYHLPVPAARLAA